MCPGASAPGETRRLPTLLLLAGCRCGMHGSVRCSKALEQQCNKLSQQRVAGGRRRRWVALAFPPRRCAPELKMTAARQHPREGWEQVVLREHLQHLTTTSTGSGGGGEWHGEHCENALAHTLFGILLWNALGAAPEEGRPPAAPGFRARVPALPTATPLPHLTGLWRDSPSHLLECNCPARRSAWAASLQPLLLEIQVSASRLSLAMCDSPVPPFSLLLSLFAAIIVPLPPHPSHLPFSMSSHPCQPVWRRLSHP